MSEDTNIRKRVVESIEQTGHHPFGPSALAKRMACPGSLLAELGRPSTSSVYADEGTFAHEILAKCLETGADASSRIGTTSACGRFTWSAEDAEAGQMYLDTVREYFL